jgi:hypothetical protein
VKSKVGKAPLVSDASLRVRAVSAVQPLLDAMQQEGFRLHPDLYVEALRLAGERSTR